MAGQNVMIALGGGPSPVINASLAGVLDQCLNIDAFGEIYCAAHGIEGVLQEELIDMRSQDPAELARLKNTPGSGFIGTCRYKLKAGNGEDFARVLDVFEKHDISCFFYIGGNDSMDTADKINRLASDRGKPRYGGGRT